MTVQTLLGFGCSLGRRFLRLPHGAVGEALACFQEPVGRPQSITFPSRLRECTQHVLTVPHTSRSCAAFLGLKASAFSV